MKTLSQRAVAIGLALAFPFGMLAAPVAAKEFPVPKAQTGVVLAPQPACDQAIAQVAAEEQGHTKSAFAIPATATAFRFIGYSTGANEGALVGVTVSLRTCAVIDVFPDLVGKRPWCHYIPKGLCPGLSPG